MAIRSMSPKHPFIVDIETVPDREHHTDDDFARPPFHKVIAIGFLDAQIEKQGNLEATSVILQAKLRSQAPWPTKEGKK